MDIKASLKYLHIAPRKVRLVADVIRNLSFKEAERQLRFLDKKAASPVLKVLRSAAANAKNNFNINDESILYIKEVRVNEGPHVYKRWRPRAMGRAYQIIKRISHVDLVLEARGVKAGKRKKTNIKSVKLSSLPKSLKTKAKSITAENRRKLVKDKTRMDKYIDKGSSPDQPYQTSSIAKKRFFSRQWLGSLNKRFFRRKSV